MNMKSAAGKRLRAAAVFKQLGPGLVTGAADDDPSGIATYSQAGAQFGFNMLWTMALTYPLMVAVQLSSSAPASAASQAVALPRTSATFCQNRLCSP